MSDYYLFQDQDNCIGCKSCQISCKAVKGLNSAGPLPSQLITIGPKMIHGLPRAAYVFMPCFHCQRPWCVSACPTGAMQKRADGIVFVDDSLCVGCKSCMLACPWGAPQWNPETRKVVKCDYCRDRIDQGMEPACVNNCTTKCLHFGKPETTANLKRERYAKKVSFDREKGLEPAVPTRAKGWAKEDKYSEKPAD